MFDDGQAQRYPARSGPSFSSDKRHSDQPAARRASLVAHRNGVPLQGSGADRQALQHETDRPWPHGCPYWWKKEDPGVSGTWHKALYLLLFQLPLAACPFSACLCLPLPASACLCLPLPLAHPLLVPLGGGGLQR